MTKTDVLKMAVQLTAGELAGPGAVGLIVQGRGFLCQRLGEYASVVTDMAE